MVFVDPGDANLGLRFDGRLAEEFKLLSGTWVRAATVRLDVLARLGDIAADVVITGADRGDIGVLLIPAVATRATPDVVDSHGALLIPSVINGLQKTLAAIGGSSSTRIARAMILDEAPSIGDGELTPKGSINVRRLLTRRATLLDRLYDDADPATLLIHTGPTISQPADVHANTPKADA